MSGKTTAGNVCFAVLAFVVAAGAAGTAQGVHEVSAYALDDQEVAETGPVSAAFVPPGGSLYGTSTADYGWARMTAYGEAGVLPGGDPYETPFCNVGATWLDTVTIDVPGLAGQQGTMVCRAHFSGTPLDQTHPLLHTLADYALVFIIDSAFSGSLYGAYENGAYAQWADTYYPLPVTTDHAVPITFGQPFTLNLFTEINANAWWEDDPAEGDWGFMRLDMTNTVSWGGIVEIRDATGDPVAEYSLTSEAGVDWTQPLPEPATLALLALGGLGVLVRRKQR
jgi:hypothetical protein